MSDGDGNGETAAQHGDRYQDRFVIAVLACAWLAVISPLVGTGLMLLVDGSTSAATLILPIATLMFLAVPASIAIVVLSIIGGMWRRWVDGTITAALLGVTLCADLVFWPLAASQTNINVAVLGSCMTGSGSCTVSGSGTDIWVGVGIQATMLVILLVCTSHWLWRLRPAVSDRKSQTLGLIALGFASVAVLAAIDLNIPTSHTLDAPFAVPNSDSGSFSASPPGSSMSASGQTTLINDLGHSVRVVYCPLQDCSGQQARSMAPNASASFANQTTSSGLDSFVVLGAGATPLCQTVDGPGDDMMSLSSADAQTCGTDVQTLTIPH